MKERTNKFFSTIVLSVFFGVSDLVCLHVYVCVWFHFISIYPLLSLINLICFMCVCIIFLVPLLLQFRQCIASVCCSFVSFKRFESSAFSLVSFVPSLCCCCYCWCSLSIIFFALWCIVSQLYPRLWNKSRVWLCVRQNAIQSHNPMWKDAKRIHIITFIIARKSQFSSNLLNFV